MPHNLGRSTFEKDAYSIRPLLASKTEGEKSYTAWAVAASCYLELPGLRGYWPLSAIDGSGNYKDLGGDGLTMTNNNTIDLTGNNALLGHPRFTRASSQYLSRGDEANFDITGTETYIAAAYQGLTFGIWVDMVSLPSAAQFIVAKWNSTGNQRSYALLVNSSNRFQFSISDNGTTAYSTPATVDAGTAIWYFLVGRYQTTTPEINLWVNETEYTVTASIPSSIYSSASAFTIGASGVAGDYLDAYACHGFLCAAALPDDLIKALYRKTKGLFGL